MAMKSNLTILFSILFLGICVIPASAQSVPDHVVINEVDTNPPGDDSVNIAEWVELYNPTDSKVSLGGWQIASTTVMKKTLVLPAGAYIEPGKFQKYTYQAIWFTDSGESVELRSSDGSVIDKTPSLSDLKNDLSSWQRIYDGYDTDSVTDWKFARSTVGSTNGKQTSVEEAKGVSISMSVDRPSYLFGQTVTISGSVSEKVVTSQPYFQPEKILLTIAGPDYNTTVQLYPDAGLNFKTTLTLNQVLGINEGAYDLSASYAGATSHASFVVGNEIVVEDVPEEGTLSIATDKPQYIPGQTVTLAGSTSEVVPLQGLKFRVVDPLENTVYTGNLFPTNGKFATTIFLTTVNPVYGTYEIIGEYSGKPAHTTFEVVKDLKESTPISLWTDSDAYGLGDVVQVTGRLNSVWINSLDLQVIQTKNTATGSSSSSSTDKPLKILDVARIEGDGSFSYSFKIPDSNLRLGDYKITVSKEIGSASKTIHVVANPEDFVATKEPLALFTSKPSYDLGDTLTISGYVENPSSRSSFQTDVVTISLSDKDGKPLQIIGLPNNAKTRIRDGVAVAYEFTAVPTSSGSFSIQTQLANNLFQQGTYLIKAKYLDLAKTISFDVTDPLDLSEGEMISLNKDVLGLGDTLVLNGILPPTGATSVTVSLTKPDGSQVTSGASIDNQRFSWTWKAPVAEKPSAIKSGDDRSVSKTNYGVYKIRVSTDTYSKVLFFKVSADPENDSLDKTPLYVSTEKTLYRVGEKLKVVGNVIKRLQGSEGLVVPERVTLRVIDGSFPYKQISEAKVYPNQGGEFQSLFELPPAVFAEGEYKVAALYQSKKAESTFSVANDFLLGSDQPVSLLLSTDKTLYHPGDSVVLTGKPSKLIYVEKFDVSVIQKSDYEVTCGTFFCGKHVGKVTTVRPSPSGSFSYQFQVPDSPSSIGTYEMTVDAGFETKSIKFDVAESIPDVNPSTVIEKQNRISESHISITAAQKAVDGADVAPRVITGSLLASAADQSDVNLRIVSESGVCVIGPEPECLVKDSTRKPGQIYDVVDVDGTSLKVRYSGPDVRLEKFDILPESADNFLPSSIWGVDIVKEDQASRFYYKITYKAME